MYICMWKYIHISPAKRIRSLCQDVKQAEVCVYTALTQEHFLINSSWQMQQNSTSRLWEQAYLSLFPFHFLPHSNSYYIQTTIFHHPHLPNLFLPSISPTLSRVFLTRMLFLLNKALLTAQLLYETFTRLCWHLISIITPFFPCRGAWKGSLHLSFTVFLQALCRPALWWSSLNQFLLRQIYE